MDSPSTPSTDFRAFLTRAEEGGAVSAFVLDVRGNVLAAFGEPETNTFILPNQPLEVGQLVHFPTASGELVVVGGLAGGLLAFAVFESDIAVDTARSVVQAAAFHRLN